MTTRREELITFDAIAAAHDPEVQKQLLKMAKADKNPNALKHARSVIRQANNTLKKCGQSPPLSLKNH